MNFVRCTGTLFYFILLTSTKIFAFNAKESKTVFYCPEKIVCSAQNYESCKSVDYPDSEYDKYMGMSGYAPQIGSYTFIGAESTITKNRVGMAGGSNCKYNFDASSSRTSVDLRLSNRIHAAIEYYNDGSSSQWNEIDENEGTSHASCFAINGGSLDSSMCPLSLASGISFYNGLITDPSEIGSGGIQNIQFTLNFNNAISVSNGDVTYGVVSFIPQNVIKDDGCVDCFSGQVTAAVTIGLQDGYGGWKTYNAGSIVVDMDNGMKILEVNSNPGLPKGILLAQGPTNSLMVKDLNPMSR